MDPVKQTWKNHMKHMNESCYKYERVMAHMRIIDGTHMNESCHTHEGAMPPPPGSVHLRSDSRARYTYMYPKCMYIY